MMHDRFVKGRPAAALALAMAAGACSDTSGPEVLDEAIAYDMAMIAADATLEDVTMWGVPFRFGPSPAPGLPGGHGGTSGEFSGTREVSFHDVNGVEQVAYDSLTTASIHILHEIQGTASRDGWTVSVHRERDMTVSGLAGTETHRTWNGSGGEQVARSGVTLAGEERSYEAEGSFVYNAVVVPIPGSVPRWPLSGTITRDLTATVTGSKGTHTKTFEVTITFDGDSTATAVVNGVSREIDLTARDGGLPFRQRRG